MGSNFFLLCTESSSAPLLPICIHFKVKRYEGTERGLSTFVRAIRLKPLPKASLTEKVLSNECRVKVKLIANGKKPNIQSCKKNAYSQHNSLRFALGITQHSSYHVRLINLEYWNNPTPPKLRFISPPRLRGGVGGGVL